MSYTITSKNILKIVVVGGLVLVGLFYFLVEMTRAVDLKVTSVSPSSALAGDTVIIYGDGFSNDVSTRVFYSFTSGGVLYSTRIFNITVVSNGSSSTIAFKVPDVEAGTKSFYVENYDAAGNALSPRADFNLTILQKPLAPIISYIYPAFATAGSIINVHGSNFDKDSFIAFDGNSGPSITPIFQGLTALTFSVPVNMSVGYYTIQVGQKASSLPLSNSVTLSVIAPTFPITLTDISPKYGPVGTRVTIGGTNFAPTGNVVQFRSSTTLAVDGLSSDGNSITFVVPAITLGLYDIGVYSTGPGGQPLSHPYLKFEVTGPSVAPASISFKDCEVDQYWNGVSCSADDPKITNISPLVGGVGSKITIGGNNFSYYDRNAFSSNQPMNIVSIKRLSSGDKFLFNDALLTLSSTSTKQELSFNWSSNNGVMTPGSYEITVTSQRVSVSVLKGRAGSYKYFSSNAFNFTLLETPRITNMFPKSGPRGTPVYVYASSTDDPTTAIYVGSRKIPTGYHYPTTDNFGLRDGGSVLSFTIPNDIENKDYGCARENPGSASSDSRLGAANLLLARRRRAPAPPPTPPKAQPPKPGKSPTPAPAPGTVGAPAAPSSLRCSVYLKTSDGVQSNDISFVVTPGGAKPAIPHISSIKTNTLDGGGVEVVLESSDFTPGGTNSVYIGQKMVVQNKSSDGEKISFTVPDELRKERVMDPLYECRIGVAVSQAGKSSLLAKLSTFFKNSVKWLFKNPAGQKASLSCNRVYFISGNGVKSNEVELKTNVTLLGN